MAISPDETVVAVSSAEERLKNKKIVLYNVDGDNLVQFHEITDLLGVECYSEGVNGHVGACGGYAGGMRDHGLTPNPKPNPIIYIYMSFLHPNPNQPSP